LAAASGTQKDATNQTENPCSLVESCWQHWLRRCTNMWTKKEKAHVVHLSPDSLIWLSRALEQPNLAQFTFMTHRPFCPDVPEVGRSGTSLKSEGLCVSSTMQCCQQHPTLPMHCPLTCWMQSRDFPGRCLIYF